MCTQWQRIITSAVFPQDYLLKLNHTLMTYTTLTYNNPEFSILHYVNNCVNTNSDETYFKSVSLTTLSLWLFKQTREVTSFHLIVEVVLPHNLT